MKITVTLELLSRGLRVGSLSRLPHIFIYILRLTFDLAWWSDPRCRYGTRSELRPAV